MESAEVETASRSTSTTKRRKRGRKGKGMGVASPLATNAPSVVGVASGVEEENRTSEMLASASQALARELSRTSRSSSFVSSFNSPTDSYASTPAVPAIPAVSKKASKWKLGFGRTTSTASSTDRAVEMETASSYGNGKVMSATASNVRVSLWDWRHLRFIIQRQRIVKSLGLVAVKTGSRTRLLFSPPLSLRFATKATQPHGAPRPRLRSISNAGPTTLRSAGSRRRARAAAARLRQVRARWLRATGAAQ